MTDLPFTVSSGAAEWIRQCLEFAEKHQVARNLVPAFAPCFKIAVRDAHGQVIASYSGDFLSLGWYAPETLADANFVELSVLGLKIYASPEALERLNGKELAVEPVESGIPNTAGKTRPILICR
jgi:hypothetical protein